MCSQKYPWRGGSSYLKVGARHIWALWEAGAAGGAWRLGKHCEPTHSSNRRSGRFSTLAILFFPNNLIIPGLHQISKVGFGSIYSGASACRMQKPVVVRSRRAACTSCSA